MKVRVKRANNELFIDYNNTANIHKFRYALLQNIISYMDDDIIISLDTNYRVRETNPEVISELLKEENIEYVTIPTQKISKSFFNFASFFGVKKKSEMTESIYIINLKKSQFTLTLYDAFLKYYDFGIGFGTKKTFLEICTLNQIDYTEVLFEDDNFSHSIYDSLVFSRLRTTITDSFIDGYVLELSR